MITVVGIGADGWPSLNAEAREVVLAADLLAGGERQLALLPDDARAERRPWPAEMTMLIDELGALAAGRSIVVLAAGDPLLHGVGATILRRVGHADVRIIPAVSSFSLACARLRWAQADVELVSATGRIAEVVAPALQPGRRLVVLGFGERSAAEIARVVRANGFGPSRLVVLEELGGAAERIEEATADSWGDRDAGALHVVALEIRGGGRMLARAPGLPNDAFEHDGELTSRELRAVALASLAPVPGHLLWDIGAGSGSVAIEWLRAAPGTRAVALEPDRRRAQAMSHNALRLGVPALGIEIGEAPAGLDLLPAAPDAIFVGGGLTTYGLLTQCRKALGRGGRLVAHVATVEGETLLSRAQGEQGGRLTRLAIAHAEPLGGYMGWRPDMPVTQWAYHAP
jgi:precorrin-6Y C5,15-methyltransferase (decarboxylating)